MGLYREVGTRKHIYMLSTDFYDSPSIKPANFYKERFMAHLRDTKTRKDAR